MTESMGVSVDAGIMKAVLSGLVAPSSGRLCASTWPSALPSAHKYSYYILTVCLCTLIPSLQVGTWLCEGLVLTPVGLGFRLVRVYQQNERVVAEACDSDGF